MNGGAPGSPTGPTTTTTQEVYVSIESDSYETVDTDELSDDPFWNSGPSSGNIVSTFATSNSNPTSRRMPLVQRTRCSQPLPKFSVSQHYTGNGSCIRQKEKAQEEEEEEEEIELAELPREAWLPACSCVSHKISMPNTKQSPFDNGSKNPRLLPSESNGLRLLQAYIHYRDANGVTKIGRVKLDTQSNGCYSLPNVSLPRKWRPWEPRVVQGIGKGLLPLGDPLSFTVMKDGEPIRIDCNAPNAGALTDGCVALLGLDAIFNLGIDIGYAVRHNKHMPVKYLPENDHLIEARTLEAHAEYQKRGYTASMLHKTCNLSERVVKHYIENHPDEYVKRKINIERVDISKALSSTTRGELLSLCKRFHDVFASHTNLLPPTLKGVEPHMFKMKEGFKPHMANRPTFVTRQTHFILA